MVNLRGLWATKVGVLLGIAMVGKVAIFVKKWIERRKDNPQTSTIDETRRRLLNTVTLNKALASASETFGYLIFALLLSLVVSFVMPFLYETGNKDDIFRFQETLLLFVNDLVIPLLYYFHNPDLTKFVGDLIKDFVAEIRESL